MAKTPRSIKIPKPNTPERESLCNRIAEIIDPRPFRFFRERRGYAPRPSFGQRGVMNNARLAVAERLAAKDLRTAQRKAGAILELMENQT